MKEGTGENLRGQLGSATNSHELHQDDPGRLHDQQVMSYAALLREDIEERRLMRMTLEKMFEFFKASSQVSMAPQEPPKKKRIHRTQEEISRIVRDAIEVVERTGWSDSRVADEIGVERRVFCTRKPYIAARLKADAYFSKDAPGTNLDD